MVGVPYTLAGREIPDLAAGDHPEVPPAPCAFCGRVIRLLDDGGVGRLLGAVVDGRPRAYLRCGEGPCSRASAPWIWRCGCVAHYIENVGDHCHHCLRPRHEAEPYDRVECPSCGETRWLDDRLGIGNGRCLACTGGPAYLPVLHEIPRESSPAIRPGGIHGE
jgi:hypothetical protein